MRMDQRKEAHSWHQRIHLREKPLPTRLLCFIAWRRPGMAGSLGIRDILCSPQKSTSTRTKREVFQTVLNVLLPWFNHQIARSLIACVGFVPREIYAT